MFHTLRVPLLLALVSGIACGAPYTDPDHRFQVDVPEGWTTGKKEGSKDVQISSGGAGLALVEIQVRPGKPYDGGEIDALRADMRKKLDRFGAAKALPYPDLGFVSGFPTRWFGFESRDTEGHLLTRWFAFFDAGPATLTSPVGVQLQVQYTNVDEKSSRAAIDRILASVRFPDAPRATKAAALPPAQDDPWVPFLECFTVQRSIPGGLEMQALDKSHEQKPFTDATIAELVAGGYLKQPTEPAAHYYAAPDGTITCRVHGDKSGKIKGSAPRPPGR